MILYRLIEVRTTDNRYQEKKRKKKRKKLKLRHDCLSPLQKVYATTSQYS